MVLLEAQSCGLPIVSFDCHTGPRNIIENGHDGILVEQDNQEEFVEKLIELTNEDHKRITLAKNGYGSVQQYAMHNVMEIWNKEIINM